MGIVFSYIGTKQVKAKPMNKLEYNNYRGRALPDDEYGSDEGYLVEYVNSPNSKHPNHENYISWSPKAEFDAAYVCLKTEQDMHSSVMDLLKFFKFEHLPPKLQVVSMPYCQLAYQIASQLDTSAETTTALRKLLESKDCAVRAALN